MAKGYVNLDDVSNYIGATLTSAQQNTASSLFSFAEQFIDRETRKSWLTPAITGERYTVLEPVIYLKQHPVTSIQSLQSRSTAVGDTLLTLTAGTDYELQDTNLGEVRLANGLADHTGAMLIFASYTPNQPLPEDIGQACCLIVAYSMIYALNPDRYGVSSFHMGDVAEIYTVDGGVKMCIPVQAQNIIDGYRLPVIG